MSDWDPSVDPWPLAESLPLESALAGPLAWIQNLHVIARHPRYQLEAGLLVLDRGGLAPELARVVDFARSDYSGERHLLIASADGWRWERPASLLVELGAPFQSARARAGFSGLGRERSERIALRFHRAMEAREQSLLLDAEAQSVGPAGRAPRL